MDVNETISILNDMKGRLHMRNNKQYYSKAIDNAIDALKLTKEYVEGKEKNKKICNWCNIKIEGDIEQLDYEKGSEEGVYYHPFCWKKATSESLHY